MDLIKLAADLRAEGFDVARIEDVRSCDGRWLTFEAWMAEVNHVVERMVGLSADDLPDFNSWDAWDGGESPRDAAMALLLDNGYPD